MGVASEDLAEIVHDLRSVVNSFDKAGPPTHEEHISDVYSPRHQHDLRRGAQESVAGCEAGDVWDVIFSHLTIHEPTSEIGNPFGRRLPKKFGLISCSSYNPRGHPRGQKW